MTKRMTDEEESEHILGLATVLSREVHLYIAAHGSSRDTLHEVLVALSLIHTELYKEVKT